MNRFGQIFFGLILVVLFIQVIIGFPIPLEHKAEAPVVSTSLENAKDRQQVMGEVHLVESRQGSRDWELIAKRAVGSEGEGTWNLTEVKVQFYSGKSIEYTVTGDAGEINTATKDMKISGKVVTRSANGYVFRAPAVLYSAKDRVLRSDDGVTVDTKSDNPGQGISVAGKAMEAHIDSGDIFLRDRVATTREVEKGKFFQVFSDRLKLSGKNSSARFTEHVKIEIGSLRIDGPEANFEYHPNSQLLKAVTISGGVKVSDSERYATAETVRFDPDVNQLVLFGKPRLVQNQDEVMGDVITFVDGGRKVRVEKMKAKVEEKSE